MKIEDQYLTQDLENIIHDELAMNDLRNTTVFITGATGLIGSMLVRSLAYFNIQSNGNVKILALVRDKDKGEALFNEMIEEGQIHFIKGDVTEQINVTCDVDYIFHTASVTKSQMMISNPVDTIDVSLKGTKNVLELAKSKNIKSMVYLSSMEMYGTFETSQLVTEEEYGLIDPLKVRSNYPESKRMCENMCVAYYAQYQVPVKIARLAQIFGAGISLEDNRVFAQFAKSAILGNDIVLHTYGKSEGNYCYTSDAVRGLYVLATKGKNAEAYNIVNENSHITIANMAKMIAEDLCENKIKVVFDVPKENIFGYAQDTKMKLSSLKLRELGWAPSIDLKEAYIRLINSLEIQMKKE